MRPDSPAATESDIDSETLWRRMLEIQRTFGCYNSARMDAALESGEGVARGFTIHTDYLNAG